MKAYCDFHIHSRYSAATSDKMNIEELGHYAQLKGLHLLGTGDALHPLWRQELRGTLEEVHGSGLYRSKNGKGPMYIVEAEVGTIHEHQGKARRIHHVMLMPSLEVAEQTADALAPFGRLDADGRPLFSIRPAELVDIAISISTDTLIYPAHAWTLGQPSHKPWWSVFGTIGGVNQLEECYEDKTTKIHALETGLSSDPSMNWRWSALDNIALLSSSDCHSPWPWRLGREACVFDITPISYGELIDSVKSRDSRRFLMTIEVDPSYGKAAS